VDDGGQLVTWSEDDRRALAEACAEHDRLMAEARAAQLPETGQEELRIVRDGSVAILHQELDENVPASPGTASSIANAVPSDGYEGWERWMAGHLRNERAAMQEVIQSALVEVGAHLQDEARQQLETGLVERDRKIGVLEGQLRDASALLAETLKQVDSLCRRLDARDERDRTFAERSARITELQRENAIARRAAERSQLEAALAEHGARVERVETQLAMLLKFIGGELPRGFGA